MKDHRRETRSREIVDQYCAEPRCKFKGKPAVHGVCYHADGDLVPFAKLDKYESELRGEMAKMTKLSLQEHYIAAMLNWEMTLDECIRLRRDNAMLRAKKTR